MHQIIPKFGRIEFLLDGYIHEFSINKDRCESILSDARHSCLDANRTDWILTANYGDHCSFCDYRPWCQTYWNNNKKEGDIEGQICSDHPRDSQSFCVRTRKSHIRIVNRNPVPLLEWEEGTFIRALDLIGDDNLQIRALYSEIFKITK